MPKFAKSTRLKFVYAHCILNQKSFLSYLTESKKTQPKTIAPKCVFNSNAALKELISIIRYILHFGKFMITFLQGGCLLFSIRI